jgi:hypothetical protein
MSRCRTDIVDYNYSSSEIESVCKYCGVAPRGRSIERPLLINGYAHLAVLFPMQREGMRKI